jgi:hypothetical protein
MRLALVLMLSAATVGCVVPMAASVNTLSRAKFQPDEKPRVWGRALEYFQTTNTLLTTVDIASGVIRSERQPSTAKCSGAYTARFPSGDDCSSEETIQFTISDDGLAILRTNRTVVGQTMQGEELISDTDRKRAQRAQDAALAKIVGAPPPAPERPPARRGADGANPEDAMKQLGGDAAQGVDAASLAR